MIHKAGFVDPGQLTFSHGGVWWVSGFPEINNTKFYKSKVMFLYLQVITFGFGERIL